MQYDLECLSSTLISYYHKPSRDSGHLVPHAGVHPAGAAVRRQRAHLRSSRLQGADSRLLRLQIMCCRRHLCLIRWAPPEPRGRVMSSGTPAGRRGVRLHGWPLKVGLSACRRTTQMRTRSPTGRTLGVQIRQTRRLRRSRHHRPAQHQLRGQLGQQVWRRLARVLPLMQWRQVRLQTRREETLPQRCNRTRNNRQCCCDVHTVTKHQEVAW